mmetsp:Transcript_9392/g.15455  ORF Transcript_9392/g.15455 Transcript_9392/m.15455 type:complete len:191 (-) Transcript_9392:368-940(-)|eukprot:CAMPEP_0184644844 /NCGR_PEP_ID=MMETSP0308-20130426/1475_1 /TAXON_ID=38269 /ORGANISM="Gloeochaete witrockiana, Strain SAG 46.84" /LENGTH=190 /DNA_ID=CAMNT_0027073567 /DNA_START=68 /DNA_END=640 /DNA_ORIENTATION=-
MVSAWVHDLEPVNECYPHTGERVDLKFLEKLGIRHFYVDANNVHLDREFQEICRQNSWKQRDLIVITPNIPNADSKLKSFFEEHMHPDEEVRAVLDGSGFFDVRVPNSDDRWIRILVEKGDCISLPGGIYHRFTLDVHGYLKCIRLHRLEVKYELVPRKSLEEKRHTVKEASAVRESYVQHYIKPAASAV